MLTPLFLLLMGLLPQRGAVPNPQVTNLTTCDSQLVWMNNNQRFYGLGGPITINLFSAVGVGCAPAELRVMAVYLDADDNVICSGTVDNVAQIDQNSQLEILEFKPLVILEFVRWRNGLRPSQPPAKRLACIGPDQLTEVSRNETDRASSVRLFLTLLTRNGGLSNLEIKVDPRQVRF